MSDQPKSERTYFMIKPDGVVRGLIGEIIHRVEQRGLKVIALQMIQPTKGQMDEHYPKDETWIARLGQKTLSTNEKYHIDTMSQMGTVDPLEIGKRVRGWLIDFMVSAPVVKMVIEGPHAVDMIRKLAGNTMPALAEMGTIRGDYSVDSAVTANREGRAVQNMVHASETPEEAAHEISHWFAPEDIHPYRRAGE